ncbi:MAG: hypothetical protein WBF53_03105 [Litorimonas sp.]
MTIPNTSGATAGSVLVEPSNDTSAHVPQDVDLHTLSLAGTPENVVDLYFRTAESPRGYGDIGVSPCPPMALDPAVCLILDEARSQYQMSSFRNGDRLSPDTLGDALKDAPPDTIRRMPCLQEPYKPCRETGDRYGVVPVSHASQTLHKALVAYASDHGMQNGWLTSQRIAKMVSESLGNQETHGCQPGSGPWRCGGFVLRETPSGQGNLHRFRFAIVGPGSSISGNIKAARDFRPKLKEVFDEYVIHGHRRLDGQLMSEDEVGVVVATQVQRSSRPVRDEDTNHSSVIASVLPAAPAAYGEKSDNEKPRSGCGTGMTWLIECLAELSDIMPGEHIMCTILSGRVVARIPVATLAAICEGGADRFWFNVEGRDDLPPDPKAIRELDGDRSFPGTAILFDIILP